MRRQVQVEIRSQKLRWCTQSRFEESWGASTEGLVKRETQKEETQDAHAMAGSGIQAPQPQKLRGTAAPKRMH